MIDIEWRRAMRQGAPLALLLIDADHFKAFNDALGHQPGDQALIAIGRCIQGAVRRAGDCAVRYGGEEFAVLLPGLSADAALIAAEIIRGRVEQLPADPIALTVSIGVASMIPTDPMGHGYLVEAADKALYCRQGRRPQPLSGRQRRAPGAGGVGIFAGRRASAGTTGDMPLLLQIPFHFGAQPVAQIVARHAIGDVGAQEAGFGAAVVPLALEFDAVESSASWPARSSRR